MTADDRLRLIRAKIERADKQLKELEAVVLSLGEATFLTVNANLREGMMPSLNVASLHVYGPEIPVIAGDVVHNLRSALDHLAYHLVMVRVAFGEDPPRRCRDIQFPISDSLESYKSAKGRQRTKGIRREAIEAMDALKPYKDGNPALWLLSKLDNADKHRFILLTGRNVILSGIPLQVHEPYFNSLDVPQGNKKMNLPADDAVFEPAIVGGNALIPTLHQLLRLVGDIVTGFRPFLEGPAMLS